MYVHLLTCLIKLSSRDLCGAKRYVLRSCPRLLPWLRHGYASLTGDIFFRDGRLIKIGISLK